MVSKNSASDIVRHSKIHSYNTPNKNTLRLPKVKCDSGKQHTNYQVIKDWNDLANDIRNAPILATFKNNSIF